MSCVPMTLETWWLLLAGVGAGLTGSVTGLASLVSYPSLLAFGLTPIVANVTNTVAMSGGSGGVIAGSRRELRGQGRRVLQWAVLAFVGGALGAVLLLSTPAEAFEAVVPWLIAFGSALLLVGPGMRRWVESRARPGGARRSAGPRRVLWAGILLALGVYAGYFGAAVGIIALAVMALDRSEPLPVTNAVKNVVTGAANLASAALYSVVAPVHWPSAFALGAGAALGGLAGPSVVRVIPETLLRYVAGGAGMLLATFLATH